jgi:hypothetical protein
MSSTNHLLSDEVHNRFGMTMQHMIQLLQRTLHDVYMLHAVCNEY